MKTRTFPPKISAERAERVRDNIQRIASRVLQKPRANPFKQHGPDHQVPEDLAAGRRGATRTKAEPFVNEQQWWQRARDEKHVVKPAGENLGVEVWFHQPAIQDVKRAADEDERIAQETMRIHSKARMMAPKPAASASLMQSESMDGHISTRAAEGGK